MEKVLMAELKEDEGAHTGPEPWSPMWALKLKRIAFIRNTTKSSHGMTPFEVMFGITARYLILSYLMLSILSYPISYFIDILSGLILSYLIDILSYLLLSYIILSYPILSYLTVSYLIRGDGERPGGWG